MFNLPNSLDRNYFSLFSKDMSFKKIYLFINCSIVSSLELDANNWHRNSEG